MPGAPNRSIAVALLDWCEPQPPTAASIAGAGVLDWGHAHVKTVRESGGALVGHRPLELDGGLAGLIGGDDLDPMVGSTWGYLFIEDLAHARFGRHFPEEPLVALERPPVLDAR
ncbi:hypothetical protein [Cellulomonas terrae]|uniref:Uncharacterized protein n=1 Tax=Cellulomonas terrae TaxID=311234 RepID=A0A511JJI3_9CELL|nr:hypothetical protein [Cellulomonas terrae]GEL98049.1 hypothetical protein CTE05_15960 [Cellulomonas terrae]